MKTRNIFIITFFTLFTISIYSYAFDELSIRNYAIAESSSFQNNSSSSLNDYDYSNYLKSIIDKSVNLTKGYQD